MDDLLMFIPTKKSDITKLEDLLKALLKNGLKISLKEISACLEKNYNIWVILFLLKTRDVCVKPID